MLVHSDDSKMMLFTTWYLFCCKPIFVQGFECWCLDFSGCFLWGNVREIESLCVSAVEVAETSVSRIFGHFKHPKPRTLNDNFMITYLLTQGHCKKRHVKALSACHILWVLKVTYHTW